MQRVFAAFWSQAVGRLRGLHSWIPFLTDCHRLRQMRCHKRFFLIFDQIEETLDFSPGRPDPYEIIAAELDLFFQAWSFTDRRVRRP
jgi:hypothetical protein